MNMRQVCRVGGMVVMMGLLATALWGCAPAPSATDEGFPELHAAPLAEGEKLRVVATTSLVADVVKQVGGERLELYTLVPLGADPHAFVPAPQDAAAVANAQVIFINGAGLETFMGPLLESAGAETPVVSVSYGIPLLQGADDDIAEGTEGAHSHEEGDPHTWFSPRNVKVWVQNIERALSALDPASADFYAANAAAYTRELEALDLWIQEQVA
ncbi:MAG TPA: metal ABC transporter substrate-binding protein, partial [Anaerolineae bacterium]|nr:metal ABC transporter substrate-binding protein [Anaerolineae bacterium]